MTGTHKGDQAIFTGYHLKGPTDKKSVKNPSQSSIPFNVKTLMLKLFICLKWPSSYANPQRYSMLFTETGFLAELWEKIVFFI